MDKAEKNIFKRASVLIAGLAVAFALAFGVWGLAVASAAQSIGSSTVASGQSTAQENSKDERVMDLFMSNFTSKLGVNETTLNADMQSAINDTASQAVQQGLITQAEADQARTEAQTMMQKGGFRAFIKGGLASGISGSTPSDGATNPKAAMVSTMNRLGITTDQIASGVNAGKSLADIAQEHGITAQALKDAILATYKTQLQSAVSAGTITQSESDKMYNSFAGEVDSIINARNNSRGAGTK